MTQHDASGQQDDVYEVDDQAGPDDADEGGGAGHTATAVAPPEPNFTDEEMAQFDADDVAAGRNIGRMLAVFFLYTVVAMSLVVWWTISVS